MTPERLADHQVPARPVPARPVPARPFPTWMVAATVVTLLLGLALQLAVYGNGGHSALSDLPRVFLHRGIGRGALPYLDRPIEYPVLSGVLLYLAALVSPTPLGVLLVTALAAGALCVTITVVLERRYGARAWRWALATPVLLYAFQNWDLFAIAAVLAGLLAFERERDVAAGAAFGLGAAVKLFPAIVVAPLAALRFAHGDRRGALRLLVSSAAVFAALNLPVLVANPAGWWWPYAFQSKRNATWGSASFYVFRVIGLPVHGASGAQLANQVSLMLLVLAVALLVFLALQRRLSAVQLAGAGVAMFVLCNKVYSPTYDVWLVLFFVMLPVGRRLWVWFCAVDVAVFVTVYGYFHGLDSLAFVHTVLPLLVAARTIALLAFLAVVLRPPPPRLPSRARPRRSSRARPSWA
jgi:uncharacterized membrane protein